MGIPTVAEIGYEPFEVRTSRLLSKHPEGSSQLFRCREPVY